MTDPFLSARQPMVLGLATSALLVFGFGAWALGTHLAGAVVAPGHVIVSGERQVVQHPDGGVVAGIEVSEAQPVRAGDVLIRLDGHALTTELKIVEGQLFEMKSRRARFEAEARGAERLSPDPELASLRGDDPAIDSLIAGQETLFDTSFQAFREQSEQYRRQIDQVVAQIDGIAAQKSALQEQLDMLLAQLATQQGLLGKGLSLRSQVLDLQRDAADLRGRIGALTAQSAQAGQKSAEVAIQLSQLATARREGAMEELRDSLPKENELAERRRDLRERLQRLDIRAPVSGTVLDLKATALRGVIGAGEPILYLVPQDRPLEIQLQISPLNIDDLHVGQSVRLTFPTFQARMLPDVWAEVTSISADTFTDPQTRASYYRADIRLAGGAPAGLGARALLPGMPVQAFIQTGERTPFDYLTRPLRDYLEMAFSE